MSNIVSKIKKKKSRLNKKDARKLVKSMNGSNRMKNLNLKTRVMLNTLYIDVQTGDVIVTDDKPVAIGNTKPSFKVAADNSNIQEFLTFLETFDQSKITKVILDNHDGFKVKAFSELIDSLKFEIERRNSALKTDAVEKSSDG